jgi:hypothetical protein
MCFLVDLKTVIDVGLSLLGTCRENFSAENMIETKPWQKFEK